MLALRSLLGILCLSMMSGCAPKTTQPQAPTQPSQGEPPPPPAHHHVERKIPTPLLQLQEPVLDIFPACGIGESSACSLLMLFRDRLELFDWQNKISTTIPLPQDQEIVRSRAPSGKIIWKDQQYIILHNDYSRPPCFTFTWERCNPDISTLPRAEPGLNFFTAGDGKFYDFEIIPDGGIAVVETSGKLSAAQRGKVSSGSGFVGGALTIHLPAIYVSSPSLPGSADQIMKFIYEEGTIHHERNMVVSGEILDLLVCDLNLDREFEMLVTIRNPQGIFIEVLNVF